MTEQELELQGRLRAGDRSAFRWVYTQYRESFLNYARKWNVSDDDILDIYQDANIALFKNFERNQLVLEKGSIKTYLFSIAKYKMYELLREKGKWMPTDTVPETAWNEPDDSPTEWQIRLSRKFGELGIRCQEILKLFYYRGLSNKEIVEISHWKDENTVKAQKSRCLKKLRELMRNGK